jgi:hypothetical protein
MSARSSLMIRKVHLFCDTSAQITRASLARTSSVQSFTERFATSIFGLSTKIRACLGWQQKAEDARYGKSAIVASYVLYMEQVMPCAVAPLAGAWIETLA